MTLSNITAELTRPRGSANRDLQSFLRNTLSRLASNDLFGTLTLAPQSPLTTNHPETRNGNLQIPSNLVPGQEAPRNAYSR